MLESYVALAKRALAGDAPSDEQCRWILEGEDVELLPLLHAAFVPRREHFGRKVMVHVLNNVQNGLCPEDCGYCSQNRDSTAPIRKYAMKSEDEILAEGGGIGKKSGGVCPSSSQCRGARQRVRHVLLCHIPRPSTTQFFACFGTPGI